MKRTVSAILLVILLTGMLCSAFKIMPAEAAGTIYIRADGRIDPPTAPISTVDNVTYTFSDNIYDSIVIERDNIVVDGSGYTVQGSGSGTGVYLSNRNNVTLKNMRIQEFVLGLQLIWSYSIVLRNDEMLHNVLNFDVEGYTISQFVHDVDTSNSVDGKPIRYLINQQNVTVPSDAGYVAIVNSTGVIVDGATLRNNAQGILLAYTTNSVITHNTIINNSYGVWCYQSHLNVISDNSLDNNSQAGIDLEYSSNNTICGNALSASRWGIVTISSSNNTICENKIELYGVNVIGLYLYMSSYNIACRNNITTGWEGIKLYWSSNQLIYENDISGNFEGIYGYNSPNNTIFENVMRNNHEGIHMERSQFNHIYHNNFLNNTWSQATIWNSLDNTLDDGYPSGGNYWSDYTGVDLKKGPTQDQSGSDNIGDTPYVIDVDNPDRYPLMYPYENPPPPTYSLTITTTACGTTNPATGTYLYSQGQSVPVQAIPNTGYGFGHWELDGLNVGSTNPYTVLMDNDHTLHAVFGTQHDVAITNVASCKTVVSQGYSLNMNVTAANQGTYVESFFDDYMYASNLSSTYQIGLQTITLNPHETAVLTFTWDTHDLAKGNYTLWAYAEPVVNETETSDNTYTDGVVTISTQGDINADGIIDIFDITIVALAFGSEPGDPNWNPIADINSDGIVDIFDIVVVALHFGETG